MISIIRDSEEKKPREAVWLAVEAVQILKKSLRGNGKSLEPNWLN
jgi:hypothetical protein